MALPEDGGDGAPPDTAPSASRTLPEGQDGRDPRYRETLSAPWTLWLFGLVMTATLGVAYGYAISTPWGVLTFVVAQAVVSWVLLVTAPRVRVDEAVFRAGRARLPKQWLGRVRVCDAETVRRLRGVDADARAYLCLRSWVPRAVVVEVDDPADPHPYWLVSSRHPERLRDALIGAQPRAGAVEG